MKRFEMQVPTPTHTRTTQSFYDRVVARLERRAAEMVEQDLMVEVPDRNLRLALAFDDLEPTVMPATARLYRAAATHAIARQPGPADDAAMLVLHPEPSEFESARQEKIAQKRAANLTTLRGPQQKAKHLSMGDWTSLFDALNGTASVWAPLATEWLMCTLATGLRPCEWRSATWSGAVLTVTNAKATNGRAHSETRTIDLSRAGRDTKNLITKFLQGVQSFAVEDFADVYAGVRGQIYMVSRRTFVGRKQFPTIYTARHCFASRAKATHPKDYVAALMGHASTDTAARDYAAARHARGSKPLEAEPSFGDVQAVRRAQHARRAADGTLGTNNQ